MTTSMTRSLDVVAGFLVVVGLVLGLVVAPSDALQGDLQRLMYVHVPAAWVAYLAFLVTLVGSVGWLRTRNARWDRLAASSAEVGVLFTGLTLVLGAVWGKPVWGVWWTWDPRLVTTALLFVVYLGYLALRRATDDPTLRSRRSAILGIVAFVQVPIVHLSVVWWRTLHQPPTVLRPGDPTIDHTMLAALLVNLLALTVVFAVLVRRRIDLARMEEAAATLPVDGPLAEVGVAPPRLDDGLEGAEGFGRV